jgi:methylmalonyl-CoA/ethylmalonyl-CoA epimerase
MPMLKIHHIGLVVKNIGAFLEFSPYKPSTEISYDPNQHSRICMLETGEKQTRLELIEPIDEKSTTYQFLRKHGNGTHHICYEIDSYDNLELYLKEFKLKRIYGPVEATVFDNRNVVFAYSLTQGVVEFLILN